MSRTAEQICPCVEHLDLGTLARAAWNEDREWHTAPSYDFDRLSRSAQGRWTAVALAVVRAAVCVCDDAPVTPVSARLTFDDASGLVWLEVPGSAMVKTVLPGVRIGDRTDALEQAATDLLAFWGYQRTEPWSVDDSANGLVLSAGVQAARA